MERPIRRMSKKKYIPYVPDTDFVDQMIEAVPRFAFFNKDGNRLDTHLISAISFTFNKGSYNCYGIVNLYHNRVPQLIIQKHEGNYVDDITKKSTLVFFDIEHNTRYAVSQKNVKEITFDKTKLSLGSTKVDVLTIKSIILSDNFNSDPLFRQFIKDTKIPCIRWGGTIETEPTAVEFISSDMISILEEDTHVEEVSYTLEEDGNLVEGLEKVEVKDYYTPFSRIKPHAVSDSEIDGRDILSIRQTPYIEFPNLMLSTTQSEENFIVQVDYLKERLDKVPFKALAPIYKAKDVDIPGFMLPYIQKSIGTDDLESAFKNLPRFKRYFTDASYTDWEINQYFTEEEEDKDINDDWAQIGGGDQQQQQTDSERIHRGKRVQRPLSFHIGVSSDNEGIYSTWFDLYLVVERVSVKDIEMAPAEMKELTNVLYIGQFDAYTDIKGYDDRYRTFFTNFGLPDPVDYPTIFKEVNPKENYPNAIVVNKKSKELFLSYKDIFPYRGTYKALLNAVKFLGYEDLYFREWYKTNDTENRNKNDYLTYIGLNIQDGLTIEDKLKSVNIDFETYLNLKKLNKLSMIYRINRESPEVDGYGVPNTVDVYNYKNADILLKLYSVREWLEKHIIGVNCQITDLTGEGIYFQWFQTQGYPNSITNFDVISYVNLTPKAYNNEYLKVLDDNNVTARVDVTLAEYDHTTIKDIGLYRISDFVKYIFDLTPVKDKQTEIKDADGQYIHTVEKVTEEPYYKLKDKNGFFDLYKEIAKKATGEEKDPGINPAGTGPDAFDVLNLDYYNRKGSLLNSNTDDWDVNNIFQVPIGARIDCPVTFDNVTYNLETTVPNGAFYKALNSVNILPSDLLEIKDNTIYNKYNYHSLKIDEDDRSKSNFVNSVILDNRELYLLDYRYDKVGFKYLPSFRIKSGKIRRVGVPINTSSLFSIDLVVTDRGQVRYGLKSDKYSERPYNKYITKTIEIEDNGYGAPLTDEEKEHIRKSQMFTLDKDVILSNDYFTFVPDRSKTRVYNAKTQSYEPFAPSCEFRYIHELDGYYFVVSGYKIQFNDTLAIYDMSNTELREFFDIRKEFQAKIGALNEYILDIYDGSIVSEIDKPMPIDYIEDEGIEKPVIRYRDIYHTEELDYRLILSHGRQNDAIDKNFIYKYIEYKVPVYQIKKEYKGYEGLIDTLYKDVLFNIGGTVDGDNIPENDIIPDILGKGYANWVNSAYQSAQGKIKKEKDRIQGIYEETLSGDPDSPANDPRYIPRYRDMESYEKTTMMYFSSKTDAYIADMLANVVGDAFFVNKRIPFDVNHVGDYKIEAFAYDKYNNIYRAVADEKVRVSQNEKDIWVGSQYLNQGEYPDFFEIKDKEDGPHYLTDILSSRFDIYTQYDPSYDKEAHKDSIHQTIFKSHYKMKLDDFGNNVHPKFPKLERYLDIQSVQNIENQNLIQYATRPYSLDGNFLSFSNITDSAYSIQHLWDPTNKTNMHKSFRDEAKKPVYERLGVHNLVFRMSLNNVYVNNLYDMGTRLDCVVYDIYNNQYIGHFDNLIVTDMVRRYNEDISYIDMTCELYVDDEKKAKDLKVLKEYDKNPYIRFYFVRQTAYTIVNYVNNIQERNCTVRIRTDKTDNMKFNKYDIVKVRKAAVASYRVLRQDELGTMIEVIPSYSETAYKVLEVKPYTYTLRDENNEDVEYTDKNYQLVILDGFIDTETSAKIRYREDLFGKKSAGQEKYDIQKGTKYDYLSFIPFTSYDGNVTGGDLETLLEDYDKVIDSGVMDEGGRTGAFEGFIRKYFGRGTRVKQPGSPVYFMRALPREGAIQTDDNKLLRPYANESDKKAGQKYIVYIKNMNNTPDWFVESIQEDNNDITNLQSFINRISESIRPIDMTLSYAHDRYVMYPFIAKEEILLKDKSRVSLDDPYHIFKYLDGVYSFISNDFDIETAYRDWINPDIYLRYNIEFYNRPTLVENYTNYIITSGYKKDENGIYPDRKNYISKWAVCQDIDGSDYLLYRFRNRSLFLKANNPDTVFNIYLDTIDEYGNMTTTIRPSNIKFVPHPKRKTLKYCEDCSNEPEWINTKIVKCSTYPDKFEENDDISVDKYSFVIYIDGNPNSETYLEKQYRRNINGDDDCAHKTPDWEITDIKRCSKYPDRFEENTDPSVDGYSWILWIDINPNSPTYNTVETRRNEEGDKDCAHTTPDWTDTGETVCSIYEDHYESGDGVDANPTWESTGNTGCSESEDYYEGDSSGNTSPKWESTGNTGCSEHEDYYDGDGSGDGKLKARYCFAVYKDTNKRSSTYGDVKYVRNPECDGSCFDPTPNWEYIDSTSYSCSSSANSYQEKTDPYADGYAFRMQKDINPDSATYGQTHGNRYAAWDSKCKGQVDDRPDWEFTGELGCSSSSSSYKERGGGTDIYVDGYAFVKYKDTNPNSPSYNEIEWRRASDRDDECVGQTDTSPKWEYVDSSSYGCSSSSSSYKAKSDIYADGYAFRQQKDMNPDSATYGNTKWVRYSSWDNKCKAIEVEGYPTIYIDPSTGETIKDYTIERIGVGEGWSSHGPKQKELPKGTVVLQVGDIVTEAHYIEVEGSTAPKEIFKYAAKLTNIDSIFRDSSVSNVPEDIFKYLPDITSFEFAFRDCEYLRTIPENLFKDNTEVVKFTGTFNGCTSLSSIPENLFANNKKVEYFGLEEEDPLIYTPSKITEYGCFARCKNIKTIPEDLFKNNTEVKSFAYTFHDTYQLKSIPAGLFRNNTKVRYFKRTFGNTDGTYNWELTSIPSTLFDNCPDVISFDGVFNRQRMLEEVPAGLFKNNKNVLNLQLCFYKSGIERVPGGVI